MKHLHKTEFYSTLETLRTTSRELRSSEKPKERCTSASSSFCKTKQRTAKGKKIKQKPPAAPPTALCSSLSVPELPANPETTFSSSCLNEEYNKCLRDLTRIKSFKNDFAIEVADFKRSLKDFELEFKRKIERPKSTSSSTATQTTTNNARSQAAEQAKFPAMHTAERAKCRRQMLRRSLSVNDLGGSAPTAVVKSSAATGLSNYFLPKDVMVPKLHIESPSVTSKRSSNSSIVSGSSRLRRRRTRKAKVKTETETQEKPPLTMLSLFELEQLPKRSTSSVTPQHPVARPNLAATLRAEVSRKKVKELKNNCTYHDPRPQYDWEVRKTPAWKSLSLKWVFSIVNIYN